MNDYVPLRHTGLRGSLTILVLVVFRRPLIDRVRRGSSTKMVRLSWVRSLPESMQYAGGSKM